MTVFSYVGTTVSKSKLTPAICKIAPSSLCYSILILSFLCLLLVLYSSHSIFLEAFSIKITSCSTSYRTSFDKVLQFSILLSYHLQVASTTSCLVPPCPVFLCSYVCSYSMENSRFSPNFPQKIFGTHKCTSLLHFVIKNIFQNYVASKNTSSYFLL